MYEHSIYLFTNFVLEHRTLGYALLFLAMLVEGEILLIVAGMLTRLKAFDLGDVLWISFAGVMIGDLLWYGVGVLALRSEKFAFLVQYTEKTMRSFLPNFNEKPFRSIFLSKFIYGANHAALIMSGILRVKLSTFIKAEAYASFVWVAVYAIAGYMFGHAALAVTHKALRFVLIAFIFVVGFVLIQRWISRYYEQQEHEESSNSNA